MLEGATFIAPPEPYIMIPTTTYYDLIVAAFWGRLKRHPAPFRYVIHPFTLDGLNQLRALLLWKGPVDSFPTARMTRGQRGGRKKAWEIVIDETHSFQQVVGRGSFDSQRNDVFGTARLLDDHSVVAWVPPLTFTLTAADARGEEGTCVISCASMRMTEYGFSFTKSKHHKKEDAQARCKRYISVATFEMQQRNEDILQQQQGTGEVSDIPLALLQRAAAHTGPTP